MKRSHENAFVLQDSSYSNIKNRKESNNAAESLNQSMMDDLSELYYIVNDYCCYPNASSIVLCDLLTKICEMEELLCNNLIDDRKKCTIFPACSTEKETSVNHEINGTYTVAEKLPKNFNDEVVNPESVRDAAIQLVNDRLEPRENKLTIQINNLDNENLNEISELQKFIESYKLKLYDMENNFYKMNKEYKIVTDQLQNRCSNLEKLIATENQRKTKLEQSTKEYNIDNVQEIIAKVDMLVKENQFLKDNQQMSTKLLQSNVGIQTDSMRIVSDNSRFDECINNLKSISYELAMNYEKLEMLTTKPISNTPVEMSMDESTVVKTRDELQTEITELENNNKMLEDEIQVKVEELEFKCKMMKKCEEELLGMKTSATNMLVKTAKLEQEIRELKEIKLLTLEKELEVANLKIAEKELVIKLAEQEKVTNMKENQNLEEMKEEFNKLLHEKNKELSKMKVKLDEITLKLETKNEQNVTDYINHFEQLENKLELYMNKNKELSMQIESMTTSNADKLSQQHQIDTLTEKKNRLVNSLKSKEKLENEYNILKSRYLYKRKRTNIMEQNYKRIKSFCEDNNIPLEMELDADIVDIEE